LRYTCAGRKEVRSGRERKILEREREREREREKVNGKREDRGGRHWGSRAGDGGETTVMILWQRPKFVATANRRRRKKKKNLA